MDYKHFQAIEYGRAPVTVHTLFVLADAFEVDPRDLMPLEGEPALLPAEARWAALRTAGWLIRPGGVAEPQKGAVPVYDLAAAAGPAGDRTSTPVLIAQATPPSGRRRTTVGLFLAQVHGTSMEPLISDGAWCLFRQPVAPPLLGRIMLVRTDPSGEGDAGTCQIKRIGALELAADSEGVRVRLDSLNPGVPPIEVRAAGEAELQVLGEFVEVVASDC